MSALASSPNGGLPAAGPAALTGLDTVPGAAAVPIDPPRPLLDSGTGEILLWVPIAICLGLVLFVLLVTG